MKIIRKKDANCVKPLENRVKLFGGPRVEISTIAFGILLSEQVINHEFLQNLPLRGSIFRQVGLPEDKKPVFTGFFRLCHWTGREVYPVVENLTNAES